MVRSSKVGWPVSTLTLDPIRPPPHGRGHGRRREREPWPGPPLRPSLVPLRDSGYRVGRGEEGPSPRVPLSTGPFPRFIFFQSPAETLRPFVGVVFGNNPRGTCDFPPCIFFLGIGELVFTRQAIWALVPYGASVGLPLGTIGLRAGDSLVFGRSPFAASVLCFKSEVSSQVPKPLAPKGEKNPRS